MKQAKTGKHTTILLIRSSLTNLVGMKQTRLLPAYPRREKQILA
jgi:hypothetical protein